MNLIAEKMRQIEAADWQDYCNACSDNFYHSSGRHAAMRAHLVKLRRELAELEAQASEVAQ